ncbi:uncharacterized protein [Pempheris klunzingeri]|uniref:uncharacterized protein n=1 Tax=Pempheris klunzingeri TaxID=3127111 RepID=UPI003980D73A
MCSTSCPLTENPAAYIWYKNRQFLYQDWSPWYQQLVSSEEAATYSCAVRGYEDLRAPEVSVDSVTSSCFSVTYAKGRMCSYKQTSEDKPCSITYPREVQVQRTPGSTPDHVRLTCNTSCPPTALVWYKNRNLDGQHDKFVVPNTSADSFSCAVTGHEDLHSAEVCAEDGNCWRVHYVSRRICAMQGTSVNISSQYSHPKNQNEELKLWYKIKWSGKEKAEELIKAAGHIEYLELKENHHILRIKNLKETDSAGYIFKLQKNDKGWEQSNFPGVTLVVTGLKVKFTPSSVVSEGQRVTVTCSTSCPLTHNTNYIWYLNGQPLTLQETQNKHLVLDPVGSQHAGNYFCAVKTLPNITSREKTLTVQSITGKWTPAAAAGICAALVLIPIAVFWCIRRKRTSGRSPRTETSDKSEQLNLDPVYDEIPAQTTEEGDVYYSGVPFTSNLTDPLYYTVRPHQPQEQEHVPYAVVSLRPNMTPACV